jgi:hypothetical protein
MFGTRSQSTLRTRAEARLSATHPDDARCRARSSKPEATTARAASYWTGGGSCWISASVMDELSIENARHPAVSNPNRPAPDW